MTPNPWSQSLLAVLTLGAGHAVAQPACDGLPTSAPVLQARSVPGPVIDAQCNASTIPGLPAAVRSGTSLPGGAELRFVDGWQAQCELFRAGQATGQLKSATVCAIGTRRTQVTGVWKCTGPDRVEQVQVGTENPRQACQQARANAPGGALEAGRDAGRQGPAADSTGVRMPATGARAARPVLPPVDLPERPLPDLALAAVREVPRSTEVDVVVRNVGNTPNFKRCWLRSSSWRYDLAAPGPARWKQTGCRGETPLAIPTLAPGQEVTLRTCGYSREEVERDTGLWVRIAIDRDCDPQRDGNNTLEYKREFSAEALRRENCAVHRDLPECRP